MFSILQKSQDNVKAEDLETLQNELERRLVDVVTERWRLEKDLESTNHLSPDTTSQPLPITTTTNNGCGANSTKTSYSSSQPTSNLPSGKLRNSLKSSQIDSQFENASDGFKGSIFSSTNGNNNGIGSSASRANSNDTDSLSSESSLTSNLTGSTIITANLIDLAAQNQHASLSNNSSSLKRGLKNPSSDRPSKRFRQNSSNSLQSTSSHPRRPPNSKYRSKIVPSKFRNSIEESRPNKKQIVKNEAPDKLWPFVEQFCATPTGEQMKGLEEMIKAMDNDDEYYKIPDPIKKDSVVAERPAKDESSQPIGSTSNNKNHKKSKQKTEDGPLLGALTQRLVSSLIVEADDNVTDASKSSSDTASSPPAKKRKSRANKGMDLNNAKNLEKRIRQQLEEHSILSQQDDIPYTSEEDENLRELLVHQQELLSIQTQNKLSMQILLKKAKRHAELEKERERLKEANAEVMAAYQRLIQAKQRKRNPTKKEKEAAWRALKVHDVIFKKCDELYLTGSDRNNL